MATSDENDLLRQVETIQSSADASAVESAVRALEPLVRETARRVCGYRRVSKQLARDFIDDSVSAMLAPRQLRSGDIKARIRQYRAAKGPFAGWLWTSLHRLLIDATRRNKRESANAPAEHVDEASNSGHSYAVIGDADEPFADRDLRLIEEWRLRDRLRLLGAAGLWQKVPPSLWESWCGEADVASPFPPVPNDFDQWNDWLAVLADAMQESRAGFKQHWYRKRKHLAELHYVRELPDEG
jgi:DNA-directed RNA polymerase specialized sigma24 family protein